MDDAHYEATVRCLLLQQLLKLSIGAGGRIVMGENEALDASFLELVGPRECEEGIEVLVKRRYPAVKT
jgi:hypothetical protein